jgi:hypothetical protein
MGEGIDGYGMFIVRFVQLSLAECADMFRSLRRPLICLCTLCGLFGAAPTWADTVVAAKRIDLPGASLQDVRAQLSPGTDANTVKISLHANKADFPALGWRRVGLALEGNLRRDPQMRWVFEGSVQVSGAPGGALSNATVDLFMDSSANTLEIDAAQGATRIGTALPLDQPSHAQITLRSLPAGWLQGLLATVWAGHIVSGKLDAELAFDMHEDGFQSSGDFTAEDLKYTTPAGNVAGESVAGHARFALDATHRPAQLALNGSLHGGQLQFGPVFARLPDHDVVVDLAANMEHGGANVSRLHLDDADALQLDGALSVDAKGNLQKIKLDHFQAHFPVAYDRYGQPWMDNAIAPNLHISGPLDGHLEYATDSWRSFMFHTDGLDLADSTGQLQANGLRGGIDWAEQGDKSPTTLGWNQLVLRKFAAGAAQSHWRGHNGALELQSPLDLPLLKGQAHFTALEWRPAAAKTQRLNLAANVADIDMATLNQITGWMPIDGTLGGTISSMQWANDRYEFEGELTIKAFDGTTVLTHLSAQQPLSDNPIVTTDVALHQLDLAPLSDVFNFGSMTGRLDGSINDLQLVGGNAVAFKASLLAQNGGKISLHAANNLSIVTGGTAASGFQGAVMKLFKTLNYKRMGINSTLQNGVCILSGLDGDSSGYTIVEGSGLPYLHVVGEQTRIDWPVLLRRLKTASQGPIADR